MPDSAYAASQALPARRKRPEQQRYKSSSHGFEAFSAHVASELGDSAYHRRLFTGLLEEDGLESSSGEETETEYQHHQADQRRRFGPRIFTRGRQLSEETVQQDDRDLAEADAHTAALGLHSRSISLASIQHFLLESLNGSLSSSLLNSESAASSSAAARVDTLAPLDLYAHNHAQPRLSRSGSKAGLSPSDRSHSSSELFVSSIGTGFEGSYHTHADRDRQVQSSYWRRLLRSLVL